MDKQPPKNTISSVMGVLLDLKDLGRVKCLTTLLYIAVNAKPGSYKMNGYIDYCKNCFLVLKNKDSTEAKNIIAKNSDQGMTADTIFNIAVTSLQEYSLIMENIGNFEDQYYQIFNH